MPMIDVYATEGTFKNRKALAKDLAAAVMRWERVPEIPLFKDNTAAFIHDLPRDAVSNVHRRVALAPGKSKRMSSAQAARRALGR
ncbi:MAG: hypothetical protein E6I28_03525 [Chloroflexi bacterium]|nr:MAG: hypothetical protein E6I28_03525 [Chloroflexota bacterium]